jgi:hypothetical protein
MAIDAFVIAVLGVARNDFCLALRLTVFATILWRYLDHTCASLCAPSTRASTIAPRRPKVPLTIYFVALLIVALGYFL